MWLRLMKPHFKKSLWSSMIPNGYFLNFDKIARNCTMDKALALHTGGQGSNPNTTKDFFSSEKIISAPIFSGTPWVNYLSPKGLE